jgi:hypothetical protein
MVSRLSQTSVSHTEICQARACLYKKVVLIPRIYSETNTKFPLINGNCFTYIQKEELTHYLHEADSLLRSS